jgi:metallo-beta-lactamase class B
MKVCKAGSFAATVILSFAVLFLVVPAFPSGLSAQTTPASDYLVPFPPYHVIGNIYFVGSKGLGIYLVTTPAGDILVNAGLEGNVPMIQQSVEQLGFHFKDIKILLISHAHFDHDAGSAKIKELTGAKYMVMDADVPVVESGGKADFFYGQTAADLYPATKVDRVLHDGDTVKLGGTVLTAHLTPVHTKGCTTWTMKVSDSGKTYDVVIVGSPNVNAGYKLVNNALYPPIASDYQKMFRVLKALPCDVFLGAHGDYYNMEAKYARLKEGGANPFIDPDGYKAYVAEREQTFQAELAKQVEATK